MNQAVIVEMHISAEEYLRYYKGSASTVFATAVDGRRVQFPAKILQGMVDHTGITGRFLISFNQEGKFENIERLSTSMA